jgi:hypothetical protein
MENLKTPSNLSYIAGFFDGEGSIHIRKNCNKRDNAYTLTIQVMNTCLSPLIFIKSIFGGTIAGPYKRGLNHKNIYNWRIDCKKAGIFLESLQPYLLVKIEQCRLALLLRKNWRPLPRGMGYGRNQDVADKEIKRRNEIHEQLKIANQRGTI